MKNYRQLAATARSNALRRGARGAADPTIVAITIAVLIVLAFAGIYTGRGFIEQARDTNAQGDLARVAAAQEFHAAGNSRYSADVDELKSGRVAFTVSTDVDIEIAATEIGWVASASHSKSGNVFYRSSDKPATYLVGPGDGDEVYNSIADLPSPNVPGLSWNNVQQTK